MDIREGLNYSGLHFMGFESLRAVCPSCKKIELEGNERVCSICRDREIEYRNDELAND